MPSGTFSYTSADGAQIATYWWDPAVSHGVRFS
jgi:hypothetical protein